MFYPFRFKCVWTKPPFFVFLVIFKIAFEPFYLGITFEREYVCADPIQEEAIVGDYNSAASEIYKCVFEGAECFDIQIICRFI